MADERESDNTNTPIQNSRDSGWIRFVGYIKRKLDERSAKKQNETPTDKAARRTATATVWMAFFTCVLALTSGLTIWILKNQLGEMHEGGIDTHALAVAAGNQADAATDMATAANNIGEATQGMVRENQRIADTAKNALQASTSQGKAALDASIVASRNDLRAWVVDDKFDIAHDFVANTGTPIEFIVKNVGRSPAFHYWSDTHAEFSGVCQGPEVRSPYKSESIVGAGEVHSYPNLAIAMNQSCVDAFHDGTATLRIRSVLHYKDIFGDAHTTTLCFQYEGRTSRQFTHCETGNEAN